MKYRKNIFIITIVCMLLVFAYFVPSMVAHFEDCRMQNGTTSVAIDEIEIHTAEPDIFEKLDGFSEAMPESKVVQQSIIKDSNSLLTKKEIVEFCCFLNPGAVMRENAISVSSTVLVDSKKDVIYQIREYKLTDVEEREYILWVDRETEMILAFHCPLVSADMNKEYLYNVFGEMAKYYGILSYDMQFYDTVDVDMIEGDLIITNKQDERMNLPFYKYGERIYFNVVPTTQTK